MMISLLFIMITSITTTAAAATTTTTTTTNNNNNSNDNNDDDNNNNDNDNNKKVFISKTPSYSTQRREIGSNMHDLQISKEEHVTALLKVGQLDSSGALILGADLLRSVAPQGIVPIAVANSRLLAAGSLAGLPQPTAGLTRSMLLLLLLLLLLCLLLLILLLVLLLILLLFLLLLLLLVVVVVLLVQWLLSVCCGSRPATATASTRWSSVPFRKHLYKCKGVKVLGKSRSPTWAKEQSLSGCVVKKKHDAASLRKISGKAKDQNNFGSTCT